MNAPTRLQAALFALRLTVFLVMLVWTLDKFVAPDHATRVFEHFYFIGGLGPGVLYVLGAVELVIVAGFLLGIARTFTYGAVLVFHGISTFSSFPMYLNPAKGMLFYAAWPMLGACLALFLLRDEDTFGTWHSAFAGR